jgi:putative ABC transport system permease protein
MRSHPEVEAAAPLNNTPFGGSRSQAGFYLHGEFFSYLWSRTTPELLDVFHPEILQGRWLEEADESVPFTPMVIDASLARALFGDEDPVGQLVVHYDEEGKKTDDEDPADQRRVVGVISSYRKYGELAPPPQAAFVIQHMNNAERGFPPRSFVVRVAPGTTAAFEEELMTSMQQTAPTWSFNVRPLEVKRASFLRTRLTPLVIAVTVSGFLIIMVGMGLIGVLWQNVTQRTQELGLRRALGATGGSVMRQVLGEILALAAVAMALGGLVFLQVPLLGLVEGAELKIVTSGAVAAVLFMVPFVSFCGLYPSWLATRVTPSRALQYE